MFSASLGSTQKEESVASWLERHNARVDNLVAAFLSAESFPQSSEDGDAPAPIFKPSTSKELRQRQASKSEMKFINSLLHENIVAKFTASKLEKVKESILMKYLPLITSGIEALGKTTECTQWDFFQVVTTFSLRVHKSRCIKTKFLVLCQNPEFSDYWKLKIVFNNNAEAIDPPTMKEALKQLSEVDDGKTKKYKQNGEGKEMQKRERPEKQEEVTGSQVFLTKSKSFLKLMGTGERNKAITAAHGVGITEIEGPILVDSAMLQSWQFFAHELPKISPCTGQVVGYRTIQHPTALNYEATRVTKITVEKVFSSLARPALLSFKQIKDDQDPMDDECWSDAGFTELLLSVLIQYNQSFHTLHTMSTTRTGPRLILKGGDNLLQDLGVQTAFAVFNVIWQSSKNFSDSWMPYCHTYDVLPTGEDIGFLEVVGNVTSFKQFNWKAWETTATKMQRDAMVTSAAGAFIAGYILGVRDRHWDNILVRNNDTLFHIDFGFILGTTPPIDAPLFALSKEMQKTFEELGLWGPFLDLCIKAFNTLRENSARVLRACKLIFWQVLEWGEQEIQKVIEQRLMMDKDDDEADNLIRTLITRAPSDWKNLFKQFSHKKIDPVWYGLLRRHFPPAEITMKMLDKKDKRRASVAKATRAEGGRASFGRPNERRPSVTASVIALHGTASSEAESNRQERSVQSAPKLTTMPKRGKKSKKKRKKRGVVRPDLV